MSGEQKRELGSAEEQAEQYLEAKYGEDFTLSDSGYQIINEKTPIPAASSKMWFKFTDGTMVCYDSKAEGAGLFYDDKQSEEIKKAIIDKILTPLFDEMGDVKIGRSVGSLENAVSFNELFVVTEEGYENEVKAYDSDGVIASLSWDCGKRRFDVQN